MDHGSRTHRICSKVSVKSSTGTKNLLVLLWILVLICLPYYSNFDSVQNLPGHPGIPILAASLIAMLCTNALENTQFSSCTLCDSFKPLLVGILATALLVIVTVYMSITITTDVIPYNPAGVIAIRDVFAVVSIGCLYILSNRTSGNHQAPHKTSEAASYLLGVVWALLPTLGSFDFSAALLVGLIIFALYAIATVTSPHRQAEMVLTKRNQLAITSGQLVSATTIALFFGNVSLGLEPIVQSMQNYSLALIIATAATFMPCVLGLVLYSCQKIHGTSNGNDSLKQLESFSKSLALVPGGKQLTTREIQVLSRTIMGNTASSISEELGIAESTVASFRSRGYSKLGVKSKASLEKLVADTRAQEESAYKTNLLTRSKLVRLGRIIAAVIIGLVITRMPPNDIEIAEDVYIDPARFLALAIGNIFVAISVFALFGQKDLNAHKPDTVADKFVPHQLDETLGPQTVTMLLVASATIGVSIYYGWTQDSRLSVISLLALVVWPFALLEISTRNRKPFQVIEQALSTDFITRIIGGAALPPYNGIALLGCWAILSVRIGDYCYWNLPGMLFVVMLAVAASAINKARKLQASGSSKGEDELDSSIAFLRSKGMGDLQSQIIARVARGDSNATICEECNTTVSTIKSYRARAYKTLGIHSQEELRNLLKPNSAKTR